MSEPSKQYFLDLLEDKQYSTALQVFIKHSGICKDMTVSDVAEYYSLFRHHCPEDANGLARVVMREVTGVTDVKSLFD